MGDKCKIYKKDPTVRNSFFYQTLHLMYVYDDDNNVNRVIWKPRNRYPKAEKTFQKWKSTHSSIWQQNQPKYPKSLYISPVLNLVC